MARLLVGAAVSVIAVVTAAAIAYGTASEPGSSEQTSPIRSGAPIDDHDWEKDPLIVGPEPLTNEDFARDAYDPSEVGREQTTEGQGFFPPAK